MDITKSKDTKMQTYNVDVVSLRNISTDIFCTLLSRKPKFSFTYIEIQWRLNLRSKYEQTVIFYLGENPISA